VLLRQTLRLVVLVFLVASPSVAQVRDPFKPAPKGYELYSWPDSKGGWNFCILYGTNREKVTEEVFSEKTLLRGLDQLKREIRDLPAGAQVFWVSRIPSGTGPRAKGSESLTYPPQNIRDEVIACAKKHHIHIDVEVIDKTL